MRSLSWCFCAREARTRVFSISRCYERAPALLRTCELTYFSSYFPFLSCRRVALLPTYPILLLSQLCVLPISLSSTHSRTHTLTHSHTHTCTNTLFLFSQLGGLSVSDCETFFSSFYSLQEEYRNMTVQLLPPLMQQTKVISKQLLKIAGIQTKR